jgi:hypothetical protein
MRRSLRLAAAGAEAGLGDEAAGGAGGDGLCGWEGVLEAGGAAVLEGVEAGRPL